MKRIKFLMILFAGLFSLLISSCENKDIEFADFDYSAVYFPYQYPVRTIVLGEDIFDNSLDNEMKCKIFATLGGLNANTNRVDIDVVVDNGLVDNLFFDAGKTMPVQAMPSNYYSLAANRITLENSLQGGVEVQLTDAFFADPKAITNTYVIPLRMTDVQNADSILSGKAKVIDPVRTNATNWDVLPRDFILYAVKFINPYHGYYLVRGKDVITKDNINTTEVRHAQFVEKDEVRLLTTLSLSEIELPMNHVNKANQELNFKVKVSVDNNQLCTVSPFVQSYQVNDSVWVNNITASGTGKFVKDGEKKSWGDKDRNAIYLQYNVSYEIESQYPNQGIPADFQQVTYSTTDTLVVRDRAVIMPEIFSPVMN